MKNVLVSVFKCTYTVDIWVNNTFLSVVKERCICDANKACSRIYAEELLSCIASVICKGRALLLVQLSSMIVLRRQ